MLALCTLQVGSVKGCKDFSESLPFVWVCDSLFSWQCGKTLLKEMKPK